MILIPCPACLRLCRTVRGQNNRKIKQPAISPAVLLKGKILSKIFFSFSRYNPSSTLIIYGFINIIRLVVILLTFTVISQKVITFCDNCNRRCQITVLPVLGTGFPTSFSNLNCVCIASDQIQLSRVIECDQRKQTTGLQNILKVFVDVLQQLIIDSYCFFVLF